MNNALWLLRALPTWFFSTVAHPLVAGPLTFVPFMGVLCLVVGTVLGIIKRCRQLLFFLISIGLSEVYVAVAGALRGQVRGRALSFAFYIYLGIQLLTIIFVSRKCRGAQLAALLLALFCLAYALFAGFVAGMACSESWL